MQGAYDPELRRLALEEAREIGVRAVEGVYAAMQGPAYETPARGRLPARDRRDGRRHVDGPRGAAGTGARHARAGAVLRDERVRRGGVPRGGRAGVERRPRRPSGGSSWICSHASRCRPHVRGRPDATDRSIARRSYPCLTSGIPGLAPTGQERIAWAAGEMPVLAQIQERFEKERPLDGVRDRGMPARDDRDGEPDADARRRRRQVLLCASNPLSTQDDVAAALTEAGVETFAIKGEDTDTFFKHINAVLDVAPADHDGRRRRHGERPAQAARRPDRRRVGRHRGDDDWRDPAARDGGRRGAEVPDRVGERRRHEAPVRQPLRHRAVDDGRDHARDEPSDRRAHVRRVRLRDVRPRRRLARPRSRRPGDRHRGRPDGRARGHDGGLSGDAAPRRGAHRRHLRDRDRRQGRDPSRAHGADEGRRDPREQRALRRRDRQGGAPGAGVGRRAPASASSSTSTRSPTGARSTCWARGAS